ncbi:YebC/PmpR family DNA-binding regulatory protein [Litorivivens lipolytica]|uniref:Probable transcriptional regulatory protein FHR99_001873 n=2 Tax=Litorivivens lipolytica TaxID=1524264 RepID=A0A7W4W694_9GAMM|nr:YebC/PmpR family DNA-binding regulatory protein [Litorivivens lipolytica]
MAKTSDAKARVYSRYAREIYVCAKSGGCEPEGNLSLRGLIERAKREQVPTHVIENAIKKAQGGAGEDYSPARYEGFGPGGCMVIIECLTDNPNRTFGDVRLCFTKTDCKIGTQGTTSHSFDHCAIFKFAHDDEEAVMECLLEAEVDLSDIEDEDGSLSVFVPHTEYFKAKTALMEGFPDIEFEVDEIQFIPKGSTPIAEEHRDQFNKFMNMLDDLDDVQRVYHDAVL